MNWLICPNSFKHSLAAQEVCDIFEQILAQFRPRDSCFKVPLGDGGQGTKHFIKSLWPCDVENVSAKDLFGLKRNVELLHFEVAGSPILFLETADLIGLELYNCLDPWRASSAGLGSILKNHIPDESEIWVGLGGSATVDAGYTLLQTIKLNSLRGVALCDVQIPLWEAGIFMNQKGVPQNQRALFNNRLKRMAWCFPSIDPLQQGGGSAGGLGFAFGALGLELVPGLEYIWQKANLDKALAEANWVVTGEGCLDEQTWLGKGPGWLVEKALSEKKQVLFICGSHDHYKNNYNQGFEILSLNSSPPFDGAAGDLCLALRNFFKRHFSQKD